MLYNRKRGERMSHFFCKCGNEENLEEEKRTFLHLLYHDKRGGQMIRLQKSGESVRQYSTCDIEQLMTGTDGIQQQVYTSVNTFRGTKRCSEQLYCYCSIYIDIDCHGSTLEEMKDAKARTAQILERAYEEGVLAKPTLITDTGRGFGIQYVLAKSIAASPHNEKQRNLFKIVRKKIYAKYEEILAADPLAAQADPAVLDDARVCRIPGTYNPHVKMYCRLLYHSDTYYELRELIQGCHLWEWKDDAIYTERKKERNNIYRNKKANVIELNTYTFLRKRLLQLKQLQDMRKEKCTDNCRELMLFIAYSALKQIDYSTAGKKLEEFNLRFVEPLDQKELDHIIEETDENEKGFYKLPDSYIIDVLGLNDDEIKTLGIGKTKRSLQKEENQRKKKRKKDEIVELLLQEETITYEEIANKAGVSRRTVCNVAKEFGISRYQKKATTNEKEKSAKKCTESVCVPFTVFSGGTVLSALASNVGSVADVVTCVSEVTDDWYEILLGLRNNVSSLGELADVDCLVDLWELCRSDLFLSDIDIESSFEKEVLHISCVSACERWRVLQSALLRLSRKYYVVYGFEGCLLELGSELERYRGISYWMNRDVRKYWYAKTHNTFS